MPRAEELTMNSVVYVIVEEGKEKNCHMCAAILRDVTGTSTKSIVYEVQLLQKCLMHQAGQFVIVYERNIFRTYDECDAVCTDRDRGLKALDVHMRHMEECVNKDSVEETNITNTIMKLLNQYLRERRSHVQNAEHDDEGERAARAESAEDQAADPALAQPAKAVPEGAGSAESAEAQPADPAAKAAAEGAGSAESAEAQPADPLRSIPGHECLMSFFDTWAPISIATLTVASPKSQGRCTNLSVEEAREQESISSISYHT